MATVRLKIKRQDDPSDVPYWEEFSIEAREGMTVADALDAIGRSPVTSDGLATKPVAWESGCRGGLCGSCAMIICGRARLACETPLAGLGSPVTIEPLSKFPVVKDLEVDRSRMFDAISEAGSWIEIDGIAGKGPSLRIAPSDAARLALFSGCVMCGACLEACPQVNERSAYRGPASMLEAYRLSFHPLGAFGMERISDALLEKGGIADCVGAAACEASCPKGIPLAEATAALQPVAWRRAIERLRMG